MKTEWFAVNDDFYGIELVYVSTIVRCCPAW